MAESLNLEREGIMESIREIPFQIAEMVDSQLMEVDISNLASCLRERRKTNIPQNINGANENSDDSCITRTTSC
jgi:hypothetical protein